MPKNLAKKHLQNLSPDDAAYWRGYFQGYAAAKIEAERLRPKSSAEICKAMEGKSIAERREIMGLKPRGIK